MKNGHEMKDRFDVFELRQKSLSLQCAVFCFRNSIPSDRTVLTSTQAQSPLLPCDVQAAASLPVVFFNYLHPYSSICLTLRCLQKVLHCVSEFPFLVIRAGICPVDLK